VDRITEQEQDKPVPIVIEITGPTNSGKTAVAVVIEKALLEAGFTNVAIDCMDGDAYPKTQVMKVGKFDIPEHVLDQPLLINDNNGKAPLKLPGA
jgi:pantothenate kinase-related protein Tda10